MDSSVAHSEPLPSPPFSREVYERNVDRVCGILQLRGVPVDDCKDQAHEVFIRVQTRWHQCRTPATPEKWIDSITRSMAQDRRKAARRDVQVFDHDADVTAVASPDDEAERRRTARLALVCRLLGEIRNATRREIPHAPHRGRHQPRDRRGAGPPTGDGDLALQAGPRRAGGRARPP